jgi:O-antigen ligase
MHSIRPTDKKYLPKMEELQSLVNNRRILLLVPSFVVVLAAGLSGLVYPSTYSPLIFSGGVLVAIVICLYFWKPKLALYTAVFVVLLPAGLIPQSYQSLLNRFLTVLAFVVWCFELIFRRRKVVLTTSSVLMLSFILWSGVSIFWAENMSSAITTVQMYIMRLILFLILIPNQIHTRKDLNGLLRTLAFVGWILILSSAVTIVQQGYTAGTRFKLLEENENAIGTLALIACLGVLWLGNQQSQPNRLTTNVLTLFYIIFMIALIGISGSRGSMLSLLIALFAFSYWRSTRRWAKLSLAIILIILVVAPTTFLTTFERFTDSSADNLAQLGGRTALWQAARQVILDHPFGGVGIGGSSYAILPYLSMVSVAVGKDSVSMHNPILTIWSELGIPGIILYLSVMVYAVRSFINQYYRYKKLDIRREFISYYSLLASIFLGYMASWVKGGGAETDHMYFLLLALLLIPSTLDIHEVIQKDNDSVQALYSNGA